LEREDWDRKALVEMMDLLKTMILTVETSDVARQVMQRKIEKIESYLSD
jgi:hypothetical protein